MQSAHTELEQFLSNIEERVYKEMEHPYLQRVIDKPGIDRFQLLFASFLMRQTPLAPSKQQAVVISLLLIHHGLEIHGLIDSSTTSEDPKQRQMTVLAGDYYSSKYYRLLTKHGLFPCVGTFAAAIREINEAKAELEELRKKLSLTEERYLQLQVIVRGALLHEINRQFSQQPDNLEHTIDVFVQADTMLKEYQTVGSWRREVVQPAMTVWKKPMPAAVSHVYQMFEKSAHSALEIASEQGNSGLQSLCVWLFSHINELPSAVDER